MLRIALAGVNGRMGQVIASILAGADEKTIVAGFDINTEKKGSFPVYADPLEFSGQADVIIDFSNPQFLQRLADYCVKRKIPLVVATTGLSESHLALLERASGVIPVFRSANMSLGINLAVELVKKAAAALGCAFDVEIIERHHNQKLDAPSGTALMLADAAASALPYDSEYVYDRHSVLKKREKNEIGIHTVRGGTIMGEHTVLFAGQNEILEIRHEALSRDIFAHGAVKAAEFLSKRPPGLYNMSDVIGESV